jgi:UDP-N-acetylglucosamine diphosphorylase / glucose-1-phosphate thymidylyltransferase / UDP-N-acetylgalactosamine diphosphorylase / glucosamine-1-phosphate N-acetyltransferase / galactosamine-1-phosphate N-acetyltransferase
MTKTATPAGFEQHICLYEDRRVADLEPLTLTRPVFDLLCGQSSLAHKQAFHFQASHRTAVVRPHLAELVDLPAPCFTAGRVVIVNGRWLPPAGIAVDLSSPCVNLIGDEIAWAVVDAATFTARTPDAVEEQMETWKATLPCREAGGRLFGRLWEIVAHNGDQIIADDEAMDHKPGGAPAVLPAIIGPRKRLHIHPSARVDPFVAADLTGGPVVIGPDAVVTAFTRLEGPCVIGPRSQVHGAKIRAGTTLGPDCRIGGEVEASIVQGRSNKYHDGFLGHAYLGEWINLGAGTQNSDLRNDYGEASVFVNGRLVRTGQTKVGCYFGDHTKTAVGVLLNTGTNAGAFCNLLPGGLLPRRLPSFVRCLNGHLSVNDDLESLLKTAGKVMARRGCEMTAAHAAVYRTVFEETAAERRAALIDAERRALRRSA